MLALFGYFFNFETELNNLIYKLSESCMSLMVEFAY